MATDNYSVLMSVYHKENPEYLRQSIDSMLAQTAPPEQFVLVCDGTLTSELDAVIISLENAHPELFNVVRLPTNQGLARALDYGLEHCRNEIVARMDSDDISLPNRCERQLKLMERHNADIVSGALMEFENTPGDSDAIRKLPEEHNGILRFARRRSPFNHPCVMFRKSAVCKAGGYHPKDSNYFPLIEDYHLWARLLMSGTQACNDSEVLLYMRTGSGMYERRGGFGYFFTMMRFKNYIRKIGLSSWTDFLICIPAHLVACIVPSSLRQAIYSKFLRGRNHEKLSNTTKSEVRE